MKFKVPVIKEMLDCPFCHDMPTIHKDELWNGSHGYYNCYEYYVRCDNKGCRVNPTTKIYHTIGGATEEQCVSNAIEDWNSR